MNSATHASQPLFNVIIASPRTTDLRPALQLLTLAPESERQTASHAEPQAVYGMLDLENGQTVRLCLSPTVDKFRFIDGKIQQGNCGIVLILDDQRNNALGDLRNFLQKYSALVKQYRIAVGIVVAPSTAAKGIGKYTKTLGKLAIKLPVFTIDPECLKDIRLLIQALIVNMETP